jgi:opacity protein-like surface antigen
MAINPQIAIRHVFVIGLFVATMLNPFAARSAWAVDNNWTFGFRVGPAFFTQEVVEGFSTDVGPAVNLQALYGISKYISVGLAIEWQRNFVKLDTPEVDVGYANTVSILPTVEVRPGRFGKFMPYGTLALGMNLNTFDEEDNVSDLDVDNTFAFRIGAGTDYFITPKLALNTELAWKMNKGDVSSPLAGSADYDASSMLFLFGVRYHM